MIYMKKSFFLILLIAFLIIGGLVVFKFLTVSKPVGKTYVVVLKEEGFTPNMLRIKVGDRVEFKTTRGENFWPASNLHPTHGIFPEFDPKRALLPNETWGFQFNKAGQWGFHDHITPEYTGKIIVTK